MTHRYHPFSTSAALVDEPVSRRGSLLLLFIDPMEDDTVSNTSKPGSGGPTTGNKPSGGSGTRPGGGAGTSPSKPGDPGKR